MHLAYLSVPVFETSCLTFVTFSLSLYIHPLAHHFIRLLLRHRSALAVRFIILYFPVTPDLICMYTGFYFKLMTSPVDACHGLLTTEEINAHKTRNNQQDKAKEDITS